MPFLIIMVVASACVAAWAVSALVAARQSATVARMREASMKQVVDDVRGEVVARMERYYAEAAKVANALGPDDKGARALMAKHDACYEVLNLINARVKRRG